MQWRNGFNLLLLLLAAGLLAAGNLWFAARRSLIPVAVSGEVTQRELRREKHPGRDDVPLIRLDHGDWVQIDQSIYDDLAIGDRIAKQSGERVLLVNGQPVPLHSSRDLLGMQWAMPLMGLVFLLTAGWVWRVSRGGQ